MSRIANPAVKSATNPRLNAVPGFRVRPETLAQATLGIGKMADGLQAVAWYKTGQMDKLEEYCRRDVNLARQLYDFGKKNGKIYYLSKRSGRRRELPAYWRPSRKDGRNRRRNEAGKPIPRNATAPAAPLGLILSVFVVSYVTEGRKGDSFG